MKSLSLADCQMIEIIKAISYNAKLIIMDEPSSSLTEKEVGKLFEFIRELKKKESPLSSLRISWMRYMPLQIPWQS